MRSYKYILAFFSGMTALAAEFSASRLLQNVFGSSNIIWAIVIGLIMVYFSVGYWLGGKIADRNPTYQGLLVLLFVGGAALGVVPYIASPILRGAALAFDALNLPILAGAFAATLVLFSIPITLLATTSPYLIRLEGKDTATLGTEVGLINAVSTFGSVFGAFVPTLFLFGIIGTTRTMVVFSVLLLIIVIIGLFTLAKLNWAVKVLLIIVPLALLAYAYLNDPAIKNTPGHVYETESAYNYIEVLKFGDDTYLRLNEGQGFHSQYNPNSVFYGGPWEQFLLAPLFKPSFDTMSIHNIAIVGLAAGTAARQAALVYPNAVIDGYEIDPKIVEVGQKYFALDPAKVNIQIGDGRVLLQRSKTKYDIVVVDAYRPPYIPPHLTTVEFFQICADSLAPNGMLAINVGRTPTDRRLINDLAATLGKVFPRVVYIDLPGTMNTILFAGSEDTSLLNYSNNYENLVVKQTANSLLLKAATYTINHVGANFKPGTVYTDDRSEIEWATNNLVINYLLQGTEIQ